MKKTKRISEEKDYKGSQVEVIDNGEIKRGKRGNEDREQDYSVIQAKSME